MVLADGSVVRADDTENADLFWAVRGAGANFGPHSTRQVPEPTRCSTRAPSCPAASGCDGAACGPMRASGSAPPWRRSTGSVPSRCANARNASRTSPESRFIALVSGTQGKLGHQG
ncbi:hypothetical protein, partial [Streptomyces parvus]|uniref:hypothetical protein n=1 Tax=Streptomyces parvus TaxID=66428 RepID=UPI0033C35E3B